MTMHRFLLLASSVATVFSCAGHVSAFAVTSLPSSTRHGFTRLTMIAWPFSRKSKQPMMDAETDPSPYTSTTNISTKKNDLQQAGLDLAQSIVAMGDASPTTSSTLAALWSEIATSMQELGQGISSHNWEVLVYSVQDVATVLVDLSRLESTPPPLRTLYMGAAQECQAILLIRSEGRAHNKFPIQMAQPHFQRLAKYFRQLSKPLERTDNNHRAFGDPKEFAKALRRAAKALQRL